MTARKLEHVRWYRDEAARQRGEPGLYCSFIGALASVLDHLGRPVDPAWLMGASGWAFRITAHKALCPSATSVFDWGEILPDSVAQAGYEAQHVFRFWCEPEREKERRLQAQAAIIAGIDRGVPAIVWDIGLPEWGLITGYDDAAQTYDTLSCLGEEGALPFAALGQREIKILSVSVVGESNGRPRQAVVRRSIETAVRHAEQGEWIDRPDYQDGLPAFEQWAQALENAEPDETPDMSPGYYASTYYGARCYARDYLRALADDDAVSGADDLAAAADAYARVAERLRPVWQALGDCPPLDSVDRPALADAIRAAGTAEATAVARLKAYLAR